MTKRYLKDWAYSKIIDYQLTSKAFDSMALILREIFDLASDEEFNIIDRNIKYRSVHKIRKTVCGLQNDISMDSFMFLVNDTFVRPRILKNV